MTLDEMKMQRDGWLQPGPKRDAGWLRPVFEFIARLPNGNVLTTDGGGGHIEWASSSPRETERPE